MRGRKHTIRIHPRVEEISEKILSRAVPYREIAEQYGVSPSAVKRFALELKNELSKRDNPRQFKNECEQAELERQIEEMEDRLRWKRAHTGVSATDDEILELKALRAKLEPVVEKKFDIAHSPAGTHRNPEFPGDPDKEARVRFQRKMIMDEKEADRRRRWYKDPFNWHKPVPPDFR